MDNPPIGIIGAGIMGVPMARNLMRAGYPLSIFTRTRAKAQPLLGEGATWRDSAADLARDAQVIISIVSDSPDVEEVYLGARGVCSALKQGTLCIDMSTVAPETALKVAEQVRACGGTFLDAPVSGGKTGAEAGSLAIMVGGKEADLSRARPIFQILGKSLVHCGPTGHGQLAKMCNQILCGLSLLGVCEAVVIARRAGLDPERMIQAVSGGAAASWALSNLGPRMLNRDFAPMFMIDLQQKDLRIALRTGAGLCVPLPGTALVSQLMAASQAAGDGTEGTQALVKVIEKLASLSLG